MKINFEFSTPFGMFRDALHLPDNHNFSPDQITAMQQDRLNTWLDSLNNPPAPESEIIECAGARYEKVIIEGQLFLKPLED